MNANNWVDDELRFVRDEIFKIDAVITGLKEVLEEHKDDCKFSHDIDVELLYELQQAMQIISDKIYRNEGGKY